VRAEKSGAVKTQTSWTSTGRLRKWRRRYIVPAVQIRPWKFFRVFLFV
jgi:hypothetical protein